MQESSLVHAKLVGLMKLTLESASAVQPEMLQISADVPK